MVNMRVDREGKAGLRARVQAARSLERYLHIIKIPRKAVSHTFDFETTRACDNFAQHARLITSAGHAHIREFRNG